MELDHLIGQLSTVGRLSQQNVTVAISLAQSLAERFQDEPTERREAISATLPREVRDLLLALAGDLAVLSVRQQDPEMVRLGLMMLAVEGGRIDYRDSLVQAAMLLHSGTKLGMNIAGTFEDVAKWITEPSFAAMLSRFPLRSSKDRDLAAFGRREARGPDGFQYQEVERPPRRFSLHDVFRVFRRSPR